VRSTTDQDRFFPQGLQSRDQTRFTACYLEDCKPSKIQTNLQNTSFYSWAENRRPLAVILATNSGKLLESDGNIEERVPWWPWKSQSMCADARWKESMVCMCMHVCTYVCIYVFAHVYLYIDTQTHRYTELQTQACTDSWSFRQEVPRSLTTLKKYRFSHFEKFRKLIVILSITVIMSFLMKYRRCAYVTS